MERVEWVVVGPWGNSASYRSSVLVSSACCFSSSIETESELSRLPCRVALHSDASARGFRLGETGMLAGTVQILTTAIRARQFG